MYIRYGSSVIITRCQLTPSASLQTFWTRLSSIDWLPLKTKIYISEYIRCVIIQSSLAI